MYVDNSGIEHESYADACRYYGADTPESLAAEDAYMAEIARESVMDSLMAGIPATNFALWSMSAYLALDSDGIPY